MVDSVNVATLSGNCRFKLASEWADAALLGFCCRVFLWRQGCQFLNRIKINLIKLVSVPKQGYLQYGMCNDDFIWLPCLKKQTKSMVDDLIWSTYLGKQTKSIVDDLILLPNSGKNSDWHS
jgi:hypothetical protein